MTEQSPDTGTNSSTSVHSDVVTGDDSTEQPLAVVKLTAVPTTGTADSDDTTLDEVDKVLEDDAAAQVRDFVQKGGE